MTDAHDPTPQLRAFGHRLSEARLNAGLSQRGLSKTVDYVHLGRPVSIAGAYISRLESGGRFPSLEVVYALADALDVDREWLLNGDGASPRS